MIPYAEFINHENVNIQYDYLDKNGQSIKSNEEQKQQKREERILAMLKRKLFLEDLK